MSLYLWNAYNIYLQPVYDWQRTNKLYMQEVNEYFTCAGDIYPSRFVTMNYNGLITQSTSTQTPFGISWEQTISMIGTLAGQSGFVMSIYGANQECWLQLGENATAGNVLSSDEFGRGIPAVNGQYGMALLLESGSTNELKRVRVMRQQANIQCEFMCNEFTDEFTRCTCQ